MGVRGLVTFLSRKAPGMSQQVRPEDLVGLRVGVDAAIMLCKGAALSYKLGPFSHLECLLRQARWLSSLGCVAVYVFDGSPPAEKAEEQAKRRQRRSETEARLAAARVAAEAAPDDNEAQESVERLSRQVFHLSPAQVDQARRLLEALGVPTLRASGEAERTLALLQRGGRIDEIFTEDVDVLICGAVSYVKDFTALSWCHVPEEGEGAHGSRRRPAARRLSLAPALEDLDCSYGGFVTLAMLAGCDFAPKLPRLGPATAYKLVTAHAGDLRACLAAAGAAPETVERYLAARPLLEFDPDEMPPEFSSSAGADSELLEAVLRELGSDEGKERSLAVVRSLAVLLALPPSSTGGAPSTKRHCPYPDAAALVSGDGDDVKRLRTDPLSD